MTEVTLHEYSFMLWDGTVWRKVWSTEPWKPAFRTRTVVVEVPEDDDE